MKLTQEQRAELFAGDHPRITFPGDEPCPVEPGHIHKLSSEVEIEVMGVTETKRGEWRVDYVLRDQRPDLLRRVPPVHDPRREAKRGEPVGDELRRAARESSTTHSQAEAVADAGERVPESYQELLSAEGVQRDLAREDDQKRAVALEVRLAEVRAECRRRGVDTSRLDARMKKGIRAYERRLADAA